MDKPLKLNRITADHARFDDVARPASFAIINNLLAQLSIAGTALQMRPAKLLVYLVIVTAAVQRVLRDPDLPEGWHGTARMPRAVIGYISRRAIAEATGLPRENVRRIVAELIAEDRLLIGPRGAVANKAGLLESQRLLDSLHALLTENARIAQRLVDSGALKLSSTDDG